MSTSTLYSPANELKVRATTTTSPGEPVTFLSKNGIVMGLNGGNDFAAGDEMVVSCLCGPQYRIPAGATTTKSVGTTVGVDYSGGEMVIVAAAAGVFDATVSQAFTTGESHVIVLIE